MNYGKQKELLNSEQYFQRFALERANKRTNKLYTYNSTR